jgi:hypothetical protein
LQILDTKTAALLLPAVQLAQEAAGSQSDGQFFPTNLVALPHNQKAQIPLGESVETPGETITPTNSKAMPVNGDIEVKDVADGWQDTAVFLQSRSFGTSNIPKGGVTFSPLDSTLLERQSSTVGLKLDTVPTDKVKVRLDPNDQLDLGKGAGVPVDVFFSPEDALSTRQVPFTAYDDTIVEGFHSGLITAKVYSNDPSYQHLDSLIVEQLIADNDTAAAKVPDPILGHGGKTSLVGLPAAKGKAQLFDPPSVSKSDAKSEPPDPAPERFSLGISQPPLMAPLDIFTQPDFLATTQPLQGLFNQHHGLETFESNFQ